MTMLWIKWLFLCLQLALVTQQQRSAFVTAWTATSPAFTSSIPRAHFDSHSSAGGTRSASRLAAILPSNEQQDGQVTSVTVDPDPYPYHRYDPASAFEDDAFTSTARDALDEVVAAPTTTHETNEILRDLDGEPLALSYLAKVLGLDPRTVQSYDNDNDNDNDDTAASNSVPAVVGSFTGLMSMGCRIKVRPANLSAFYKLVIFASLPHAHRKGTLKLRRDVKSYGVVAAFLQSHARTLAQEATGVVIPECYDAQLQPGPDDQPLRSKFSFLLQDLAPTDGWYQRWLLHQRDECHATLSTLAKLHAYFWTGSSFARNHPEAATQLEEAIWASGSYVQPAAQGQDQWRCVAKEWLIKRQRFADVLEHEPYWDTLGERLQSVAYECGRLAHPFAPTNLVESADGPADPTLAQQYRQFRTWTHGDPKQANWFFRRHVHDRNKNNYSDDNLQVGLIDFQWCGFGLAATDVAHILTSAIHADRLVDGGETELLRYYYDELQHNLVKYGVYDTTTDALSEYSYEVLVEQYEIAVLDLCRLMIAYTWDRFEEAVDINDDDDDDNNANAEADADADAARARTMNKTSYNKSIPNIVWLLTKCDEILISRGV